MDLDRSTWEIYQDMMEMVPTLSTSQLLTLANTAMNSTVAMAASDELARRRPQGR